ncbi:restriction endonuclease subunit S [Devosia sp. BSSL-BM10]|uniref:Restriction endonuclease subunit S n=2 Tax=Devosia litorisediminis TaxID=2829817 RepID=A0A942I7I9_9HYPH|nr:restriction endonuclease subunit S [Devosia litorisediminis]
MAFIQEGPGIRKYEYQEDGFPMINVRCVQDGFLDMSSARAANTDLALGKWRHFQVDEGDILFTISGTIGRCAIVTKHDLPLLMNTSVVRFRSIDPRLDTKFLYLFLQSDGFQLPLKRLSSGAAIQNVGPTHIKMLSIPVPPLEEQQRIVAILDEAFEGLTLARANAEANLQNARELFETYAAAQFDALTSDSCVVLSSVTGVALPDKGAIRTGPFGSQLLHNEFVDEGIAVLGIDNAVANKFRWGKSRFITEEKYAQLKRYTVRPGDVIITIMGTCGRCAVVPDNIPLAINTKHLCCISLDRTKCLPEYLHHYFLFSPAARSYLSAQASGSVMDGLNMGIIKDMPVQLPSIGRQETIIANVSKLQNAAAELIDDYETKLQGLGDLRRSLLQKAFAGELT